MMRWLSIGILQRKTNENKTTKCEKEKNYENS